MLIRKESYIITTLCKADQKAVERTNEVFNTIRCEIIEIDPECIHVNIVPRSCVRTQRSVCEKTIDVFQLTWDVEGEKDILERFFDLWKKQVDKDPFRSFYVKPNYSLKQIVELMSIR